MGRNYGQRNDLTMDALVVAIRTGSKYGPEYVSRLYAGLSRWTTHPFDMSIIQRETFPGWWQKVLLFGQDRRIIYLDLDVVLTGPVDFLFEYQGLFCIWGDPWNGKWNSSVMSIGPGFGREIRDRFLADSARIMRDYHGDQDWIAACLSQADLWQDVAPRKILSYKADDLTDSPRDASICVFHGDPKPHTFTQGWVHDAWI